MNSKNYYFEDFTESSYRSIIRKAKSKYSFIGFDQFNTNEKKIALWRHDIDYSIHRALALAKIEKDEGVKSTFFIYPHSEFYNIMESSIVLCIKDIVKLGHDIGLHFDPSYYFSLNKSKSELEGLIEFEKKLLYEICGFYPNSISIHNPDASGALFNSAEAICGMVNAYSDYLKNNYKYCSDSNGYWRYDRLPELIESDEYDKIHVLTHPGWWVETPMSPRQRIQRCINGRAINVGENYDNLLDRMGRENVK